MGHNAIAGDSWGSFMCIITDMITHDMTVVKPREGTGGTS